MSKELDTLISSDPKLLARTKTINAKANTIKETLNNNPEPSYLMQIKLFKNEFLPDLEKEVNNWIKNNPSAKVLGSQLCVGEQHSFIHLMYEVAK